MRWLAAEALLVTASVAVTAGCSGSGAGGWSIARAALGGAVVGAEKDVGTPVIGTGSETQSQSSRSLRSGVQTSKSELFRETANVGQGAWDLRFSSACAASKSTGFIQALPRREDDSAYDARRAVERLPSWRHQLMENGITRLEPF